MPNPNDRYSFTLLKPYPHVSHGYFPRSFGSVARNSESLQSVLLSIAKSISLPTSAIKLVNQVHGDAVYVIPSTSDTPSGEYDGLVTNQKNIFLGIKTADCLPLVFFDGKKEIIGACHAGYKGLLIDVIPHTLNQMRKLGASTEDIIVGIGPSICESCYTVSEERINLFQKKYPELKNFYTKKEGLYFLHLRYIARSILKKEGISSAMIEEAPFCTKERTDLFFSRRAEPSGVFLTGIGLL